MVATKAALSVRIDALAEPDEKSSVDASAVGVAHRAKLESRLRAFEYQSDGTSVRRFADSARKQQQKFEMSGDAKIYNSITDDVALLPTQRESPMEVAMKVVQDVKDEKKRAKEERKAKRREEKEKTMVEEDDSMAVDSSLSKKEKKEKKRKRDVDDDDEESPVKVCSSVPRVLITLTRLFRRKRQRRRGRPGKRPRKLKKPPPPQRRTGRHRRRRKSGSPRLRSKSVAFYIISTVHTLLSCIIHLSSVQKLASSWIWPFASDESGFAAVIESYDEQRCDSRVSLHLLSWEMNPGP
jgi:hypothetical protein